MKKTWIGAIAALSIMLGGCGIHRTTVRLAPPETLAQPDAQKVVIGDIRDQRDFLITPDSHGDRLDKATRDELGEAGRASVVGGAVRFVYDLPKGERVEDVVKALLVSGLQNAGYRVVKADDADAATPVVSADIKEFWCYMPFNFGRALTWTMQLRTWVDTAVTFKGPQGERSFVVSGRGGNISQFLSEENIQQAYQPAFEEYIRAFRQKANATL
ncbi:MAG: hypothetical protein GAK28_00964 [Luteibacter sp.]|uniref:hypothetical protein n=1 Tax=Luteibacter sp. TaxID=1886636 RepID=UPI001383B6AE|nr:hypothetical protein [Luteibacter sp.]KAF1008543.1 MAG: hypothetical protein GAK28_00964 [Luteibacter sp.]